MSLSAAIRGDRRSRQIVATVLEDMLSACDRTGQLPCPVAAGTAVSVLVGDYSIPTIRYLRRDYHEVINACARFVMSCRWAEDAATLFGIYPPAPGHCPCDTSGLLIRDLHSPAAFNISPFAFGLSSFSQPNKPSIETLLNAFAILVNACLNQLMSRGTKGLLTGWRHATRRQRRGLWPTSLQDVVPYGVESSIIALCAWAKWWPSEVLARLVHKVWDIAARPGCQRLFIRAIIPGLVIPVTRFFITNWRGRRKRDTQSAMEFLSHFKYASQLLLPMTYMENQLFNALVRDTEINWTLDILACSEILDILRGIEQTTSVSKDLTYPGIWAYRHLGAHLCRITPSSALPSPLNDRILQTVHELSRVGSTAALVLYTPVLFHGAVCGNPGCPRTDISEGHTLAVCTGCYHMYYCSRGCQKTAWHHPSTPHKDICAAIHSVVGPMYGRTHGLDAHFGRELEPVSSRFTATCKTADPRLVSQIVDYLTVIYNR